MGATFARTKTWVTGETLNASDLNSEFDSILNNLSPTGIDDYSTDVAGMQSTSDPYPGSTESLATSISGELERIRYLIKQITGETQWYIDPDTTIASLFLQTAGSGLSGGAGTPFAVNVDDSTIEISTDTLRVKDAGITAAKLAAAVAGDGLTNNGTGLVVNVDNSTIETNSDALRVKDAGIVEAKIGANAVSEGKLAAAVVAKLGQNIGLIARVNSSGTEATLTDAVNYTGQGRLLGVYFHHTDNGGTATTGEVKIILDGVDYGVIAISNDEIGHIIFGSGNSTTMFEKTTGVGTLDELRVSFKTSLQIQRRTTDVSTDTMQVIVGYERQA